MPLPTLIFLIILAVLIVYLAVWLFCIRPRSGLGCFQYGKPEKIRLCPPGLL